MPNLTPLEAIDRAMAERCLGVFIRQAFPRIVPAPYRHNWHIDALAEHLQAVAERKIRNLVINIPPRHMKSLAVNVFFPAFVWCQDPGVDDEAAALKVRPDKWAGPGVRFLSASHSLHNVTRDNAACRRLIETPWYRRNWGERVVFAPDQNAKAFYANLAGGARFVTTVNAGVTGEGGDIVIIDDPIDAREAGAPSRIALDTCIRWFSESMPTRVTDPMTSCVILVMQHRCARRGRHDRRHAGRGQAPRLLRHRRRRRKKIASDPGFKQFCILIRNGVDWDVALALEPHEAEAMSITMLELESGASFNWDEGRWVRKG
jgi:hypothetical protein